LAVADALAGQLPQGGFQQISTRDLQAFIDALNSMQVNRDRSTDPNTYNLVLRPLSGPTGGSAQNRSDLNDFLTQLLAQYGIRFGGPSGR
jgi:hypothetical protein